MDYEKVLAYCLAKPGAWQDMPWEGDVVAKVGPKIFAFLGNPDSKAGGVGLKCGRDAEEAREWRDRYPGVRISAYIGRYGWNVFPLDGTVPAAELRELVDASYDAIVSKLPKSQRPPAS